MKYIKRPFSEENPDQRRRPSPTSKSAIFGAFLLVVGCFWLGWLLLESHNASTNSFTWPLVGSNSSTPNVTPVPQLSAEGIDISQASSNPNLNQQQAILIANQLEPVAAASAKTTSSKYVLLNYVGSSSHASVDNVSVWMILYQQIPSGTNNTFVDPNASTTSYHDLYVFVDANSGKEVLSVWL